MQMSLMQATNHEELVPPEELPLSGIAKVGKMPNQLCLVLNQYSCLYIV